MKKRLTDAEKWRERFIKELPKDYKLFWLYLYDECDNAGIWTVEMDIASVRLGVDLDIEVALNLFGDRIYVFGEGDKWFLRDFMILQYAKKGSMELNLQNDAVKNALNTLTSHGLSLDDVNPMDKGNTTPGGPHVDPTKEEEEREYKEEEEEKEEEEKVAMFSGRDAAPRSADIETQRRKDWERKKKRLGAVETSSGHTF